MVVTSTGLAFSGGGIRSAAFCSGVLCRLLESGVEVDYLSCVSGGGYTGTAYLDWKYQETKKARMEGGHAEEGKGRRDWHKDFFEHMIQRSGYICNWTEPCKGILDTIVLICLIILVTISKPLIKWGAYVCPVAFIIDHFFGELMRESADCDAALALKRKQDGSAVADDALIKRCLDGSDDVAIAVLFSVLFILSIMSYILSRSTQRLNRHLHIFLRLSQYVFGSFLVFTFIPFAIYDFFVKIPLWTQVFVGTIAVIVWVVLPLLRIFTSYVLIVYLYSSVIYWKVFQGNLPVFNVKYDEHDFHRLLFASGLALWIAPVVTTLQEKLVHVYNRWRLQKAFYHKDSSGPAGCSGICPLSTCLSRNEQESKPLTLADLKGMKPKYLSNMVVNHWKKSHDCEDNYELLIMSPTGIERFDRDLRKKQFEGKLDPEHIMLSDAMATSAAALSTHMGKYDRSIEGLTLLYTILGLEMGATMKSDVKTQKKESLTTKIMKFLVHIVRGLPLIIVPTLYRYDKYEETDFDSAVEVALVIFFVVHLLLAFIAIIDTGAEQPRWWEKLARWFIVHNSFVSYVRREIFSKNNIGPMPPPVLLLGDGGHFENLAILPLLKRKLKRIVVVDGGYKQDEKNYGDSLLNALMLARTKLNCSFFSEDGPDIISNLLQTFVKPQPGGNPRYCKFKVHYARDEFTGDGEGEILLIAPRCPQHGVSDEMDGAVDLHLHNEMALNDIDVSELTFCCCECCHRKSCHWLSKILCNVFPQHNTANQFFTPPMFSAYHHEGYRACVEAKADGFLKDIFSQRRQREESSGDPDMSVFQPPSFTSKYESVLVV